MKFLKFITSLYLTFQETARLFSQVAAPFCIPTNNAGKGSSFSTSWTLLSSAVLILAGCEVLSHGGLSCISVMVGAIEHLFRFPFILLLRINC